MQDNADNNDARSFDKKREQLAKLPRTDSCFASESHSHKRKATGQHSRKSKRANERRALDVGFSDEEDEDAELHFLEKISSSKRAVSRHNNNQGGIAMRGIGEDQDYVEEDRTSSDESILEGKKSRRESADLLVTRKQSTRNNRNCSLDSFKDVLPGPVTSFIDISGSLLSTLSESEKFIYFRFIFIH
jgi:hypothetical protein